MKNLIRTALSLMLCLVVCSFLSPTALAETIASGTSGDNLNWNLDNEGTLFISGYGDLTSSDGWSEHIESIKTIVIEQEPAEAAQETAEQAKDDAEAAAESVSQSPAQIETNKQDIDDLKSALDSHEKKIVTRNLFVDSLDVSNATGISIDIDNHTYRITTTRNGVNLGAWIKAIDVSNLIGERIYISLTMQNATFNETARLMINTFSKADGTANGTQKNVTLTNGQRINTYFDVVVENSYIMFGLYSPATSIASGNSWEIANVQCELNTHTPYVPHEVITIVELLSPELFGAIGDGITDDSAPIQDYINTGLSVTFPNAKTYVCSNIEVNTRHSINLNGATLITKTDAPIFITSHLTSAVNRVHIFNGFLQGDSQDASKTHQSLIYLSCFYSTFENLHFSNCYEGVHLIPRTNRSGKSTVENVFRNLKFNNCYHIGLKLAYESGITDNRIEGIFASAPAGAEANIYIGRSAGLIMSNVHLYGTPAKHIILRSTAHTIVSNAYIEGGYTHTGIDARLLRTLTVSNTIIIASNPNTIMFSAIDLGSETPGFRYVSLNGVTFESYKDLGIESVTPISLGTGCVATGSNLTINDIYNAIEDVDPDTGLTATRLIYPESVKLDS